MIHSINITFGTTAKSVRCLSISRDDHNHYQPFPDTRLGFANVRSDVFDQILLMVNLQCQRVAQPDHKGRLNIGLPKRAYRMFDQWLDQYE